MTVGQLSLVVNVLGILPYAKGILWGKVRPERMTWFIWSLILALSLVGYKELDAGDSLWFVFGDFLVSFSIFVLSIFRGAGGLTRLDLKCLALALLGLAAWQFTDNPVLVFAGTITADIVALVPTLQKALRRPDTEHASTYLASTAAAAMGFVAVGGWNWSLMFYPIYLFLANAIVAEVIVVGQYQVQRLKLEKQHA